MKPEWKQFLLTKGATFEGTDVVHFGKPELDTRLRPQSAVLCDLSQLGLISVVGEDAKTFLQSQLSNDIQRVSPQRAQLSSYNSPKGRTYTTFHIFQRQGVYYLSCASDVLETVLKRLKIYVLRSKVVLENASDRFVRFGYVGANSEKDLKELLGTAPEKPWDLVQTDTLTIMRQAADVPRFEIYAELDEARHLWEQLHVHATPVSGHTWDYFDIASGIPRITLPSIESWVPQMINLHLLDGISFTKGCFPGQEIVARLKYLGQNKRQMYRFLQYSGQLPAIGADILNANGEAVGQVLNAALNPDGNVELLAVVKIALAHENLSLNGLPLTLQALPYVLDAE
ncbi:YgfZ/GcvT domain-containing protein [Thiolinea disciformis]|uniref:CAF17-like 4Fe-4S cluster assembly/insertion protein YgfZ n=1 Tax=Thiolinea disciformis TaxID=125614 RepID=UPI000364946D|nr:folate-binding protein YgfZ [Thiolinea disciformis]